MKYCIYYELTLFAKVPPYGFPVNYVLLFSMHTLALHNTILNYNCLFHGSLHLIHKTHSTSNFLNENICCSYSLESQDSTTVASTNWRSISQQHNPYLFAC